MHKRASRVSDRRSRLRVGVSEGLRKCQGFACACVLYKRRLPFSQIGPGSYLNRDQWVILHQESVILLISALPAAVEAPRRFWCLKFASLGLHFSYLANVANNEILVMCGVTVTKAIMCSYSLNYVRWIIKSYTICWFLCYFYEANKSTAVSPERTVWLAERHSMLPSNDNSLIIRPPSQNPWWENLEFIMKGRLVERELLEK